MKVTDALYSARQEVLALEAQIRDSGSFLPEPDRELLLADYAAARMKEVSALTACFDEAAKVPVEQLHTPPAKQTEKAVPVKGYAEKVLTETKTPAREKSGIGGNAK